MGIQLKAAVGKVLITPEEQAGLQGFDPDVHIAHPPEDILDELFARILLLDDGRNRSVIVSVDCCLANEENVTVPLVTAASGEREFMATFPSGTRKNWAKAAGTDVNSTLLMATHTHSAPAHFGEKYMKRIEETITQLTQCLVPVKLSICKGLSAISAYRRPLLSPNLDVAIDHSLNVVLLETESGKLLGGLVNYAVHPTILHPPAPANRVSAELVGWAMNELEEEIGDGFIALFAQGFSGDVCPILPGYGASVDTDTYGNVKKAGHLLYMDIEQTMQHRQPLEVHSFSMKQQQIALPNRPGFSQKVTLTGIALGELVLLCASGEIFNGYVNKFKAVSPFTHNVLISQANGYSGYLPTQEAFRDGMGGYEMNTTPFVEAADDLFTASVANLLRELHSSNG